MSAPVEQAERDTDNSEMEARPEAVVAKPPNAIDHATVVPSLLRSAPNEVSKARLTALTVLHNGDKATLWERLKRVEIRAAEQQDWDIILAARRREVVDEAALFVPVTLNAPEPPTDKKRERHKPTYSPPTAWCEHCVTGRRAEKAHRQQDAPVLEERPSLFELDH